MSNEEKAGGKDVDFESQQQGQAPALNEKLRGALRNIEDLYLSFEYVITDTSSESWLLEPREYSKDESRTATKFMEDKKFSICLQPYDFFKNFFVSETSLNLMTLPDRRDQDTGQLSEPKFFTSIDFGQRIVDTTYDFLDIELPPRIMDVVDWSQQQFVDVMRQLAQLHDKELNTLDCTPTFVHLRSAVCT